MAMALLTWVEWVVINTTVFKNNKKSPSFFGGDFFLFINLEVTGMSSFQPNSNFYMK